MNENGVGGKSSSSSGTGTPRGQDSRSVSPTHESTTKSQENTGLGAKTDSSTS